MDGNDSDSSLSDAESGAYTTVLLGYASAEPTEDLFSRLGGEPTWLDDAERPSATLAQCKNCSEHMALLLQLNGDMPERFPGHERRLYLWACRRKACRRSPGSVRATRAVRLSGKAAAQEVRKAGSGSTGAGADPAAPASSVSPALVESAKQTNLGATLFGGGSGSKDANAIERSAFVASSSNPFSTGSSGSQGAASALSGSNPFMSTSIGTDSSNSNGPLSKSGQQAPAATSTLDAKEGDVASLSTTFAEKARLSPTTAPTTKTSTSTPKTPAAVPWPARSALPAAYSGYYLDAEYEFISDDVSTASEATNAGAAQAAAAALMDVDRSSSGAGGAEDKELYESTHDKTFQHFADRLAQNPEQILRYEFGGAPLLYSRTDSVGRIFSPATASTSTSTSLAARVQTLSSAAGTAAAKIPRCENCGASRVFEAQLAPHAIVELEAADDDADEGMEWGTIIFCVCSRDCSPRRLGPGEGNLVEPGLAAGRVDYLEEWVGVQWEELISRNPAKR